MAERLVRCIEGHIYDAAAAACPTCGGRSSAADAAPAAAATATTTWQKMRLPVAGAGLIAVIALAWIAGLVSPSPAPTPSLGPSPLPAPTRATAPTPRPRVAETVSPSAWQFFDSPTAGNSASIPRVSYIGSADRGFRMSVECRGSGPSMYISIENPDASLQQLRFDTPIPVTFSIDTRSTQPTDSDSARVTAQLTQGYMASTNSVTIGMGLADAARAVGLIMRNERTASRLLAVEIAGSAATFDLTGARDTFTHFKRLCDERKL